MAQNVPWDLKNSNISWGRPPRPPPQQWEGAPPSYTYPDLTLHAKIDGGSATIVSPCY